MINFGTFIVQVWLYKIWKNLVYKVPFVSRLNFPNSLQFSSFWFILVYKKHDIEAKARAQTKRAVTQSTGSKTQWKKHRLLAFCGDFSCPVQGI